MPGLVIGSALSFVGEAWVGETDVPKAKFAVTGSGVFAAAGSSILSPFLKILDNPNLPRCYLIVAQVWDKTLGALTEVRFSSGAAVPYYDSKLWLARAVTVLDFESTIGSVTNPAGSTSGGSIEIALASDEVLTYTNYFWDSRSVKVYMGAPDSTFADFGVLLDGNIERATWQGTTLRLVLRDSRQILENYIQTDRYTGTGGLNGGADIANSVIPLLFGVKYNIAPKLIDVTNQVYQIHAREISAVLEVRDAGVAITSAGNISDVYAWTPVGGQFVTDLIRGVFRLGAAPAGTVTCDAKGEASGGYVETACDIIDRIITYKGGAGAPVVDAITFAATNTSRPWVSGHYADQENTSVQSVIDTLSNSIGGWTAINSKRELTIGLIAFGTPVLKLDRTDFDGFQRIDSPTPSNKTRIGYRESLTEQTPAAGATDAQKAFVAEKFRWAIYDSPSTLTAHPGAKTHEIQSALDSSTDAATLANDLGALLASDRFYYQLSAIQAQHLIKIGDTITISDDRYFTADKDMMVISVTETVGKSSQKTGLKLWG